MVDNSRLKRIDRRARIQRIVGMLDDGGSDPGTDGCACAPPAEAPTVTTPRSVPLRRVFVLAIVHWLPVPPLDNPFLGLTLRPF